MNIKHTLAYTLCALLLGSNAFAAGFQLRYQSAEAMGTGFSSAGTTGQALSQTYFNPASYMLMNKDDKKSSFAVEGLLILPLSSEATTDGSGNTTDDFADTSFAPAFYYGRMFNDTTALTVSLTTPWATGTDYDNDWDGRYQALETSLQSLNLTPAISKKIMDDKLILSGGVQIQYLTGVLSRATTLGPGGDIKTEFSGDSLDFGLTLGATYLLSERTTIAFNYISAISNKLEGDVEASDITSAPGTAAGLAIDSDNASLRIKTPDIISLGVSHIFSEKLTGHTSANVQTWSSFEELNTKIDGNSTGAIAQEWDDSFFLSAGVTYETNEALTLRTGFFYESGAPGDLRSPRTVDADKVALALGGSYTLPNGLKLDAALNQIFYTEDIEVDLPAAGPSPSAPAGRPGYTGEIENQISLLRVGVTYNW